MQSTPEGLMTKCFGSWSILKFDKLFKDIANTIVLNTHNMPIVID